MSLRGIILMRKINRVEPDNLLFEGVKGRAIRLASKYKKENDVTLYHGDCLEFLKTLPAGCSDLIVTSPPYNIGKEYEK